MVFCEYLSYVDEIRPQYQLNAPSANAIFSSSIVRNNGASLAAVTAELDNQVTNLAVFGENPRCLAVNSNGTRIYAAFALSGNHTTLIPSTNAPPQSPPTNPNLPPPP